MEKYNDDFKKEMLTEATHECAKLLIPLMKVLEIPNFVETKIIVNNDEVYKLRIEKLKKKSLMEKIRSYFL